MNTQEQEQMMVQEQVTLQPEDTGTKVIDKDLGVTSVIVAVVLVGLYAFIRRVCENYADKVSKK